MYKIILTISEEWTPEAWMEFSRIADYVFLHFKGDTHSLIELAVSLDRVYRDKKSNFYPVYMDNSIMVHLKDELESVGLEELGPPCFTIKTASSNG